MKYLFIVQGEGRGHLTQAMTMEKMLLGHGHEVVGILVGTSSVRKLPEFFEKGVRSPLHHFDSFNFVPSFKNRKPDVFRTVIYNLVHVAEFFPSIRFISSFIKKSQPDVVVNFYEFLGTLGYIMSRSKAPEYCIGHQYLLLHKDFRVPEIGYEGHLALNLYSRMTSWGAKARLALSFRDMPDDPKHRIIVMPPLLRPEVLAYRPEDVEDLANRSENDKDLANRSEDGKDLANGSEDDKDLANRSENVKDLANGPEDGKDLASRTEDGKDLISSGNYILGYMLNSGFSHDVMHWHYDHPETELRFFWDKIEAGPVKVYDDSLTFYYLDDKEFLHQMAGCKAYASTAGFESICEAMYMGKPLMMVPSHIEQKCNAFDATRFDAAVEAKSFDLGILLEFADKKYRQDKAFPAWARSAEKKFLKYLEFSH